jgi:hypothetical protein
MRILNLLLLLSIFILSCTDEETKNGIEGTWKLTSTSGTITGAGIKTDWNKLIVSDKSVSFYKDNSLVEEGSVTYTHDNTKDIHKVKFSFSNKISNVIDLKSDPEKIFKITKGKLDLISDCCDRVDYHLEEE